MQNPDPCVLIVEDDPLQRRALERMLVRGGYPVISAPSGQEATRLALRSEVVVAIVDLGLPDISGIDLIERLHEVRPSAECIVLTGTSSDHASEEARLAGASDYFEKPIPDSSRFLQVVKRAWEVQHLRKTINLLDPRDEAPSRILGQSPAIIKVRHLVDRMAGASAPVMITGESGVGKEVVAEALHEQGRRKGEFVRINCAALPESLIEAELFGAEEGTFTGQNGKRDGLFSLAENGTLFLDEIGEMPIGLQPKLLRVLQSGQYRPLGARNERTLTARVIAATNVDLHRAIARGAFREDLYFRLAVLTIDVPPLRERREDIGLLAWHFAKKYAASEGRSTVEITDEGIAALREHSWPGNVREMSNTVLRAIILSSGRRIGREELDLQLTKTVTPCEPSLRSSPIEEEWSGYLDLPLTEAKAAATHAFTRYYLERRLAESGGNVSRAAARAGMQRPNFKREMRKHGVGTSFDDDPTEEMPPPPDAISGAPPGKAFLRDRN